MITINYIDTTGPDSGSSADCAGVATCTCTSARYGAWGVVPVGHGIPHQMQNYCAPVTNTGCGTCG